MLIINISLMNFIIFIQIAKEYFEMNTNEDIGGDIVEKNSVYLTKKLF